MSGKSTSNFDVAVVGAGYGGLYAVYRLRQRGFTIQGFDAADGPGGTWWWNRYPGCRVDMESHEYSYSFSPELQQEWRWSERYAPQPELLRYLDHVAERFDLKRSYRFSTRIEAAHWDEKARCWRLTTDRGDTVTATHVIMATGFLSKVNKPTFAGLDRFVGRQFHTARWPHDGVDFTGRRVAVIGTGSSAIQSIPHIAEQAAHLTVFQRTPAFAVPAWNRPMDAHYERMIKSRYAELRHMEYEESFGGFVLTNFQIEKPEARNFSDCAPAERCAEFEKRYANGGLNFVNSYPDLITNEEANEALAEFVREKIRQRVKDPAVAELLCPRGYPIMTKRLCVETNYYETYNRPNVTLVDIRGKPIETFTEKGLVTGGREYEFDDVVFATGFDAMTGALTDFEVRGRGDGSLKDHWASGPRTFLGLMSAGFPNLYMLNGPGSPSPVFQPVLLCQFQVDRLGDMLAYLRDTGFGPIEATVASEDAWVAHCNALADATLFPKAKSWYMGLNIPGKARAIQFHLGGFQDYRRWWDEAAALGYQGYRLG